MLLSSLFYLTFSCSLGVTFCDFHIYLIQLYCDIPKLIKITTFSQFIDLFEVEMSSLSSTPLSNVSTISLETSSWFMVKSYQFSFLFCNMWNRMHVKVVSMLHNVNSLFPDACWSNFLLFIYC